MNLSFKGRPITKDRLGWWFRIALTRLFGRHVKVEGRDQPLKILPWIHKGKLMLMGAEHDFLQIYWTNQYTTEIRSCPDVPFQTRKNLSDQLKPIFTHIILCHQAPEVVRKIYELHRIRSNGLYKVFIAYGGIETNFKKLGITDSFFVHDSSLRGRSNHMSHYELIEGAFTLAGQDLDSFYIFSESDLLPLTYNYLDPLNELLNKYNGDFIGKNIRDITSSNNGFFADAVSRNVAGMKASDPEIAQLKYYHSIGCFFGVRGNYIPEMLKLCERMKTLYFEVMFPTAAIASGCVPLSLDSVSRYLENVRYRPFYDTISISSLEDSGTHLCHPVKGSELLDYLNKNIPTMQSTEHLPAVTPDAEARSSPASVAPAVRCR